MNWPTFEGFGTLMDLTGSAGDYLAPCGSEITGEAFYAEGRRKRIDQYQDNLPTLGHHGSYLETCRWAFVYCQ